MMNTAATTETRPGYKLTKLGWIPEEWEVVRLEKFIDLISGQHLEPSEYSNIKNGMPYFTGPTDFVSKIEKVNKWTVKRSKLAKKNDVLITVKGSGVGRLSILALPEVAIGRQLMAINSLAESNLFLYYFLSIRKNKFQVLASGNLIPGLSRKDILKIKIPLPPLPEQQKIAAILSTWDRAIATTEALIAQLQLRKKGLMQQLLTGKKRLPGFEGEWEQVRIGKIANEYSVKNKEDKRIEVLSCTKYDGLVPSLEYFGRKVYGDDLSKYKVVPQGHFAYATNHIEEGSIGYQNLMINGLVSPMYTVFKTLDFVNDLFLFKLLKTDRMIYQYQSNMSGSIARRGGLRWDAFKAIEISLPEKKEQTAITAVLTQADTEIQQTQTYLAQLQQQKKGLMQQLLTGQKRVRLESSA